MFIVVWILSITRKIYNAFAGSMTPAQVAYGLCIGLFVAFMPMGLRAPQTWAVIALVLVTRASLPLLLLSVAIVKPLMFIGLDALPWIVGRFVLEDLTFLQTPLRALLNLPGIALVPFERYAVMGGFVTALVLSAIIFFPVRAGVIWFRETVQPRAEQYRLIRWWRGFFLTRFLSFVFVGGS